MNRKIVLTFLLTFVFLLPIWSELEFKLVETWEHDELIPGKLFDAIVDEYGDVVTGFQRSGVKIANSKTIVDLGPFGQGPSDIDGFFAITLCDGDLAVEGMAGKLKIFSKKEGKYKWKQTIWKKFGGSFQLVRDGVFKAGKWFFTGAQVFQKSKNEYGIWYIRVYDRDGKFIKNLIKKDITVSRSAHLMDYLLAEYKDKLFFIAEDEPIVRIIDPLAVDIKKEITLKMPDFYKPMPVEFYAYNPKDSMKNPLAIARQWADWKTGYTRINRVGIDGDHLVLQVRTCKKELGLFALLFYNAESFTLDRVVYTNDLLLDIKGGKFYMFANGNPGYDDEAGDYIVNIYQFEKKSNNKKVKK